MTWTGKTLQFADHGADITEQTDAKIAAKLQPDPVDPYPYAGKGVVFIYFDSPTHATWTWYSLEGEATGDLQHQ